MTNTTASGIYLRAEVIGILVISALSGLSEKACGYSPQMRRAMMAGPWEIVVQISADGGEERGLSFPLNISDENKREKLDAVLPIMGTPAARAWSMASSVWGMIPSSPATTRTTKSVICAPRALIAVKASWPGVSRNVILPLGRTTE